MRTVLPYKCNPEYFGLPKLWDKRWMDAKRAQYVLLNIFAGFPYPLYEEDVRIDLQKERLEHGGTIRLGE